MQEMPREQRQTLWGKLDSLLQAVLQEFPAERWEERKEDGMEVESAGDPVSGPQSLISLPQRHSYSYLNFIHIFANHWLSRFLQKHAMAVVDAVTLVATLSLKVLQDGDTYSALLQIAHRLHGWSPRTHVPHLMIVFPS